MAVTLVLFWPYQIKYHPLLDIKLRCVLSSFRNGTLQFYFTPAVLCFPLSPKSCCIYFGQNSLRVCFWLLHLRNTPINTLVDKTLQISDQGKHVAPWLEELRIISQESVFVFKKETITKEYTSLSVKSEIKWEHYSSTNWQVLVFLLIEDLGHVWDGTLGIPFGHHMCVPNAAITLWPQMLFSFTSWVL